MCYHGGKSYSTDELEQYYELAVPEEIEQSWKPIHHDNGFDHNAAPVVTRDGVGLFRWGLIPWYTKTQEDALQIRIRTLNCISEEMYEKPAYRDSINDGKRCLIPMTGFFEWQWLDPKGKEKLPYYIHVKNQKIFSVAGIYSEWRNKNNDQATHSYSVLTCKANPLMSEIHNNKKRMPVIIEQQYEKDWLNQNLTKDDVLALCQPLNDASMEGYTISKKITSKKDDSNVPDIIQKVTYDKTTLF